MDSTIATNDSVVKTLNSGAGFFYTNANGGSSTAEGTIRAGFYNDVRDYSYTFSCYGPPNSQPHVKDFYYMVADPNYVNTGLQVKPKDRTAVSVLVTEFAHNLTLLLQSNGFCEAIQCDSRGCPQAFSQPPTRFPPPTSVAPLPPNYRCPIADTDYDIMYDNFV